MGYKFYNKDGVQTGYSVGDNENGCWTLVFFSVVGFSVIWCFDWIVDKLTSWQSHPFPYNHVSQYYYRMVEWPISFISFVFEWSSDLQLTIYPNINGIIGLMIPLMLIISFIFSIWFLLRQDNRICIYIKRLILAVFLLPVIGIIIWFFIEITYYWLIKIE